MQPRLIPAALLTLATLAAVASPTARAVDYYAGGDLAWVAVPVASTDFDSFAVKFRAGASLPSGWGVEIQTLFGLGDDSVGNLTLQTDNVTAAFIRYGTKPEYDTQFFALAGYATSSLSFSGSADTSGLDDSYSGFAFGFGLTEKLKWLPNTRAILELNSYFADDDVDVWAVSFGLQYDF
ncbi:MAG: outer membrane beta-barrel protein [Pseudomonadota bacterium]